MFKHILRTPHIVEAISRAHCDYVNYPASRMTARAGATAVTVVTGGKMGKRVSGRSQ